MLVVTVGRYKGMKVVEVISENETKAKVRLENDSVGTIHKSNLEEDRRETIYEAAVRTFGDRFQMTNKSLTERIKREICRRTIVDTDYAGRKRVYFEGSSITKVDGAEFPFSVTSLYVKKTKTYKLVSDH